MWTRFNVIQNYALPTLYDLKQSRYYTILTKILYKKYKIRFSNNKSMIWN